MKEVVLSKAIMSDKKVDDVIIKINDDIPNLFEMSELYDSSFYFRDQAIKLADALYMTLPVATLKELIINLTQKMYGLE